MKTNVTIIGFGTMGRAIAQALAKDSSIKIFAVDKDKKNTNGIKKSDFVILAVKPQDAKEAVGQLKEFGISKKAILISIMAGVSIKKLLHLAGHKKIVRMMPNLGLSVGAGIAGWKKSGLSEMEAVKAKNFINKITENFEVKNESDIDKITAISGSGPAYFFLLADCLLQAAKKIGLPEKENRRLVGKTLLASALLAKDLDYSVLIKKIASKGGTTEAALKIFKNRNFNKIVSEAVRSAHKRAKELSNG